MSLLGRVFADLIGFGHDVKVVFMPTFLFKIDAKLKILIENNGTGDIRTAAAERDKTLTEIGQRVLLKKGFSELHQLSHTSSLVLLHVYRLLLCSSLQVERMVNEADKFAKEKDTKNQADSVVYQTEKQLKGTRRQSSCICERKAGDQTR
ncbi:uncharacterized protein LOC110930753 isoform X1 [Helianthus annuus]|nr:uncharacterized protein LOC110930753 isoform X1 [Helianthus annuus]XP_035843634.1 uncharacterized protein LOC110930753 isoform X1 [Helianthus annuus]XP_035843635.1 uncharacterized protein LOC110930753 isoform X1 [Helianthus annuus]XP_035843636.1 uncharacterized protein LOC110930753 isoform X1 [Helianthus annuus]XP_035843637.1 uncharacterized protein LOC110930753 isoform X1 [Helianthus annuus]XP_035843638.1 uncharacterized protein LOC110930753 isoform X1 [Helianthus annuus]XP_035843639.1 un